MAIDSCNGLICSSTGSVAMTWDAVVRSQSTTTFNHLLVVKFTTMKRRKNCRDVDDWLATLGQALVVLLCFGAHTASAIEFQWAAPLNRSFTSSSSWSPTGVPGPSDTALFATGQQTLEDRYEVYLTSSRTIDSMRVLNDYLLFAPQNRTLTIAGADNALAVARDAGQLGFIGFVRNAQNLGGTINVTNNVSLGGHPTSNATLLSTVDLNIGGDLFVADAGMGVFNQNEQGHTTVGGDAIIAAQQGTEGRLFVLNTNARMDITGELSVGEVGDGLVNVLHSGTLAAGDVRVAKMAGSNGEILLEDSEFEVSDTMVVGDGGFGRFFTAEASHTTIGADLIAGAQDGGEGIMVAEDAGSQLDVQGAIVVGEGSDGDLIVRTGATANAGEMKIGPNPNGSGRVIVQGIGSALNVSGPLDIGMQGYGEMFVELGAQLATGTTTIGTDITNSSFLQVSDADTHWIANGDLNIGEDAIVEDGLDSRVALFRGATVDVTGTTHVLPTGILNVQTGTLTSNTLRIDGQLFMRDNVVASVEGTGNIDVQKVTSLGDASSTAGFDFSGDIMIGGYLLIGVGAGTGTQNVVPAQLTIHDADRAIFSGGTTIIVDGGVLDAPNGIIVLPGAELQVQGGPGLNHLPEEVDVLGGATIHGDVTNHGIIRGPKNDTQRMEFSNNVDGNGTFTGWVEMRAGVSPGSGIGALAVENLTLRDSSAARFELGGAAEGEFDTLVATGQIALAGTLEIVLSDLIGENFLPAPGDSFQLIVGTDLIGDFASILLPDLSAGLSWNLMRNTGSLILEVTGVSSDFNQNGVIDGGDFLSWQRDPSVGDLSDWQSNYGASSPLATAPIASPEPTTLLLLASAIPALCTRRIIGN